MEHFPVDPEFSIIKVIVIVTEQHRWHAKQFDVQNAFPNGILEQFVFVQFSTYIYNNVYRRNNVMKLKRSLYVLHVAARIWHKFIKDNCQKTGLKELQSAPCLFTDNGVIMACYVDDVLICAKH